MADGVDVAKVHDAGRFLFAEHQHPFAEAIRDALDRSS
jgi:hypothetical protein